MGTQLPPPQKKKGTAPQFSAHVCCGQMAGLIKMPLGTDVGVSPGHIVLDGDSAPPKRGHSPPPPIFNPYLLWPNGRPSQLLLSTCYTADGRLAPCDTCDDGWPLVMLCGWEGKRRSGIVLATCHRLSGIYPATSYVREMR